MYDEYNTLIDTFNYNIERYGIEITVSDRTIKALFKRRSDDSGNTKNQYLTMFTSFDDNVEQGEIVILHDKRYLALKDNSNENTVYNKTHCIDCNHFIKYELKWIDNDKKADLTEFYIYGEDISASILTFDGTSTINSTCHFIFPLNDLTRRIRTNDRFFADLSDVGVWKIRDINYQNNLCNVYCIRDVINEYDDIENLIADRWLYETKPDNYLIQLEPSTLEIQTGNTDTISVTVYKNDELLEPTPQITYNLSQSGIVDVDATNNRIEALSQGEVVITGSYKINENDTCETDSIKVTVTAPSYGEVIITPAYNKTGYYGVRQSSEQLFTASITGVDNPVWNITLDAQGISSSKYISTISNNDGTFKVKCNSVESAKRLKYTITETISGKSTEYLVGLISLF